MACLIRGKQGGMYDGLPLCRCSFAWHICIGRHPQDCLILPAYPVFTVPPRGAPCLTHQDAGFCCPPPLRPRVVPQGPYLCAALTTMLAVSPQHAYVPLIALPGPLLPGRRHQPGGHHVRLHAGARRRLAGLLQGILRAGQGTMAGGGEVRLGRGRGRKGQVLRAPPVLLGQGCGETSVALGLPCAACVSDGLVNTGHWYR